jgi:4-amino-4-deoxy-L-arabinose transferase-like glycosyltransferase
MATMTPESAVMADPPPDAVASDCGQLPAVGGAMRPRRFFVSLTVIVAVALAFRVGYVLLVTRHQNGTLYDSFWYYSTTIGLHSGQFFRAPFSFAPSAAHPPMTSLLLGGASLIVGLHGVTSPLLTMAALGAAVVLCVGLLGRAVAGPWVGLTAAGLAALAPNFWMPSGILMSETPSMLFMALILLAVVRLCRSPTVVSVVFLGAACGLEALVRAELLLFVPGLLVPAVLLARCLTVRRRLLLLGIGILTTVVVLAPWVGRNLATFTDATYISTGDGLALLGSNCSQTYSGPDLGLWSLRCATSDSGPGDESVQSARKQHAALTFVSHHLGRIPVVALARVAREWDLYKPVQMAHVETNEGRPLDASLAGLGYYYVLLPFAVAGVVMLRRRRIDQWFLLVPAGVVTLVSALIIALIRYRAPFEVCLVVLAAPPMVSLARRVGRGRTQTPESSLASALPRQRSPQ